MWIIPPCAELVKGEVLVVVAVDEAGLFGGDVGGELGDELAVQVEVVGAGELAGVVSAVGLFANKLAGEVVEVDGGVCRGQLEELLPARGVIQPDPAGVGVHQPVEQVILINMPRGFRNIAATVIRKSKPFV